MKTILRVLIVALLFFLTIGIRSVAYGANLDVCPNGCPYLTIQSAIDAMASGDKIGRAHV